MCVAECVDNVLASGHCYCADVQTARTVARECAERGTACVVQRVPRSLEYRVQEVLYAIEPRYLAVARATRAEVQRVARSCPTG